MADAVSYSRDQRGLVQHLTCTVLTTGTAARLVWDKGAAPPVELVEEARRQRTAILALASPAGAVLARRIAGRRASLNGLVDRPQIPRN